MATIYDPRRAHPDYGVRRPTGSETVETIGATILMWTFAIAFVAAVVLVAAFLPGGG